MQLNNKCYERQTKFLKGDSWNSVAVNDAIITLKAVLAEFEAMYLQIPQIVQ